MRNCRKHFKKQRICGFTLSEIVVVMMLLGLIILLATSIILIVNKSQQISQLDSNNESDILKIEVAFKDWLMLFDSETYTIKVADSKRIEITGGETSPAIYMQYNSLDNNLTYTENVENIDFRGTTPKTIIFSSVNNITFDICNGNIIRCTASFKNTDYKHIILYYVRTATIL